MGQPPDGTLCRLERYRASGVRIVACVVEIYQEALTRSVLD